MEQRIIKVTLPYPLQSRGEERDREDAISFASRKSLNSRRQSQRRQQRQTAAAAGNNRQALHPHTASMRSKRSVAGGPTPLGAKKYPQVCMYTTRDIFCPPSQLRAWSKSSLSFD